MHWRDRESALAGACELFLDAHPRGLPAPAPAVISSLDRPYRTVDEAASESLLSAITNPDVAKLPAAGSIERRASSVDILYSSAGGAALRSAYQT